MTAPKVIYIHDNPGSVGVQVYIAHALGELQMGEEGVIAFGFHLYGKLAILPEEIYQGVTRCSNSRSALGYLGSRGLPMDASQLLHVSRRQDILEGRLELWGVEDPLLLSAYEITQQDYWKLQQPGENNPNASRERTLKSLEAQLEELKQQRIPAIVANTQRILTERKILFLPLVMGYAEYLEISQKLQEKGIEVISYEG